MPQISTGFHWIGIALAVPIIVLAIAWASIEWISHREVVALAEARAVAFQLAEERALEFGTLTSQEQERVQSGNVFDPFDQVEEPDYAPAGALAGLAIAIYSVGRGLGRIVIAFMGGTNK